MLDSYKAVQNRQNREWQFECVFYSLLGVGAFFSQLSYTIPQLKRKYVKNPTEYINATSSDNLKKVLVQRLKRLDLNIPLSIKTFDLKKYSKLFFLKARNSSTSIIADRLKERHVLLNTLWCLIEGGLE